MRLSMTEDRDEPVDSKTPVCPQDRRYSATQAEGLGSAGPTKGDEEP